MMPIYDSSYNFMNYIHPGPLLEHPDTALSMTTNFNFAEQTYFSASNSHPKCLHSLGAPCTPIWIYLNADFLSSRLIRILATFVVTSGSYN